MSSGKIRIQQVFGGTIYTPAEKSWLKQLFVSDKGREFLVAAKKMGIMLEAELVRERADKRLVVGRRRKLSFLRMTPSDFEDGAIYPGTPGIGGGYLTKTNPPFVFKKSDFPKSLSR